MTLRHLFVDMNSYFASVEQQMRPELRGKPVAVIPVEADSTFCIAASYEAKAFGVKTGTRVSDARTLCPGIRFVLARGDQYIRTHHKIVEAVDACVPVSRVLSIDEMVCQLDRRMASPEVATQIARQVKDSICNRVGKYLKCSIGIAPNRLLAKVASDMVKPDGLVVIQRHQLPDRLFELKLTDFPGIGPKMYNRFQQWGITTVPRLLKLNAIELAKIWGSKYLGSIWWNALRGYETPETPTHKRSIGHSKVLAPQERNDRSARTVLVRLLHKAAARLRHEKHWTCSLTVQIGFLGNEGWHRRRKLEPCQDTLTLLEAFTPLWEQRPNGKLLKVGIVLGDLERESNVTPSLFCNVEHRNQLAGAMDSVNQQFGRYAVFFGGMYGQSQLSGPRVAFNAVPDLALADP